MKFSGKVGNRPKNKRLNFGGDLDHRLDTGIVFRIRQYWEIPKVVNGHSFILIRQVAALVRHALTEVCTVPVFLVTGSIARSATCRYLIYSEADFEVFRPARATRCTDWSEIWRSSPPRQILPQSVQRLGYRSPKTEIFTEI